MIDALSQAALSLSMFPLSTIVKATLILVVALFAARRARRARAATRHLILAAAFGVVLALPVRAGGPCCDAYRRTTRRH